MNKIIIIGMLLIATGTGFYYFNQADVEENNPSKSIGLLEAEIEAAIESKRYYDAKELINESIDREPENPERYIQLGNLEASRGMTTEALTAWEDAVKLNPNNISVRFKLAHLYEIVGETTKANVHLEAVAKIDPEAHAKGAVEYFAEISEDPLVKEQNALRSLISIRNELESYFSDNQLSFVGACESVSSNLTVDLNGYSCSTAEYDYRISVTTASGDWLCFDGREVADIFADQPTGAFCPGSNALEQLFPLDHQLNR